MIGEGVKLFRFHRREPFLKGPIIQEAGSAFAVGFELSREQRDAW